MRSCHYRINEYCVVLYRLVCICIDDIFSHRFQLLFLDLGPNSIIFEPDEDSATVQATAV